MTIRYGLAVLWLCVLGACGGPSIDSMSDETFASSIEVIRESLSGDQLQRFDRAIEGLEFLAAENALSALSDSSRITERLRRQLARMNAEEVIAFWTEELDDAITRLEEKKAATELAMEALKTVEVRRARYYTQNGQPVVELVVLNNTPHTISRVFFRGVLTSPGRRTPWVEDDFNYNIPQGMKPGELETWNFALLSPVWQKAPEDTRGLRLNVEVTRIDGEDNKPIYDAYTVRFSRRDRDRLEKLKSYLEAEPAETTSGDE